MHRTVFGTVLLALSSIGGAAAADLAILKAPASATYDWSGIYLGGHIGGGWARHELVDDPAVLLLLASQSAPLFNVPVQTVNSRGFLGGVQVGANYQIGKLVVGA